MYDDDYEEFGPSAPMPPSTVTITNNEFVTRAIVDAVSNNFVNLAKKEIREQISATIRATVKESTESICREMLQPLVAEAIEEGWVRTDNYGNAIGGKVDIKQRIGDMLNANAGGYSGSKRWIDAVISQTVEAHLAGEFRKELKEATAKLRKQFDDTVAAEFVKTIRSGLGLR